MARPSRSHHAHRIAAHRWPGDPTARSRIIAAEKSTGDHGIRLQRSWITAAEKPTVDNGTRLQRSKITVAEKTTGGLGIRLQRNKITVAMKSRGMGWEGGGRVHTPPTPPKPHPPRLNPTDPTQNNSTSTGACYSSVPGILGPVPNSPPARIGGRAGPRPEPPIKPHRHRHPTGRKAPKPHLGSGRKARTPPTPPKYIPRAEKHGRRARRQDLPPAGIISRRAPHW